MQRIQVIIRRPSCRMWAACYTHKHNVKQTNQFDRLMSNTSDSNASSAQSRDAYADSSEKQHESDDAGSQQPSPNQYRQKQANKNAYGSQDDDESDNEYEGVSDMTSDSDDEDDALSNSSPTAPSATRISARPDVFSVCQNDLPGFCFCGAEPKDRTHVQ
jgi:hypothetical protein